MTTEEIQQQITNTFDSVNLINNIVSKTISENITENIYGDTEAEIRQSLINNKNHIEIMIAKDWLIEGATSSQMTTLNNAIEEALEY
tara:strand:+ start:317 stop:577 length:261 start_codon:yes stop_codon:yes gene_type:complete